MSETSAIPPAAWHADPTGRHQYRYWDGAQWTDFVADDGVQTTDPLYPAAPDAETGLNEQLVTSSLREARRAPDAEMNSKSGPDRRTLPGYLLVGADGYPSVEVEGEFARVDAIHKALGRKPRRDEEVVDEDLIAALVPEPKNKFDSNAVMVKINGQHVGYLAREDAARYKPMLAEVLKYGYAPATRARIWASARPDWDNPRKLRYVANIRLALNPPHLIVPLNDPPHEAYSILPWGSALQVTGEEQHQRVLGDYLNAEGDGVALGTLHIIPGGTARAPKELIELQIDGERVGQLTPASSAHFVPTVRHLEHAGLSAVAWLRVKGNAIAAQVTIQATKAHELPADWFAEPHTIPSLRPARAGRVSDSALDDAGIRTTMQQPMWGQL